MKNLDELTAEDFRPHIGESFAIGKHAVTLKSVDTKPSGHKMFREQVSLLFEADADISVDADIAKLSHPKLGRFDLLVHRIEGPEDPDAPPLYEIIFN